MCGAENPANANFCSSCGAKLGKKSQQAAKAEPQQNSNGKQLSPTVIIMSLVGLIAVGVIILYFAGVFETPSASNLQANVQPKVTEAVQDDPHSGVDLGSLQQIKEMETFVANNPDDLQTLLKLAHLLNDSGFYAKAIERYQEYLSKNPDVPDVLIDMGVCYFEMGQYDNAIKYMKHAIEINPKHQIGLFNLGIVNSALGRIDEAKSWWQKSYNINPNTDLAKKAKELINQN